MRRNKFQSLRKFERLEDRRMMAADIDLENDILTVQGTENRDNITIRVSPEDPDDVRVTIANRDNNLVLIERDYDRDDVDQIFAYGYGSSDILSNITDIDAELFGADGVDELESWGGQNVLHGGPGGDLLYSGPGTDELVGGPDNDVYYFQGLMSTTFGSDVVNENPSVDTDTLNFRVFLGTVNLNLAATVEQIVNSDYLRLRFTSDTGIENVIGNDRENTLYGNGRDNVLWGGSDRDYLYGRGGNDDLFGGRGNDFLYGDAGLDELFGEDGYDDLYGGSERDILRGGIGNDDLFGEAGNDDLFGEDGNDYLFGGSDRDILRGGNGVDQLYGEAGNDDLFGEAGADYLEGGADSDYLDGGYFPTVGTTVARDQLFGVTGADTFVRHRKRLQPNVRFEDFLDFNTAIDRVFEVWH